MNAIISMCHFCELHGPRILFCTQPFRPQEPRNELDAEDSESSYPRRVKSPSLSADSHNVTPSLPSMKNDMCEGCYSVQPGYVSHDEEAHVSYVSTQHPYHPQVFSRIRQACIRSLSCEVCPGREGPIFFGDEQYGYVLSYTFYVEDSQARGLQRSYSIVIVMMDKIYLLNSWPFLVPHLKTLKENLQARAHKVYTEEQAKCPQTTLRLNPSINPANFIQQRGGNKPARSLVELTGHKNVFKVLHFSFIWILKACGNRMTETLLEGPPTEDSIIDMEKQEETEEGFIKLYSRKISENQPEQVASEDEGCIDSDVEQEYMSKAPFIKDLRLFRKALGNSKFHTLAHHVLIGNQVIISGAEKSQVKAILAALKMLLPKGCCRAITYSNTYEESWRCNFLGLALNVPLPNHTMSTEMFILVEVLKGEGEEAPDSSLESEKSLTDNCFSSFNYRLSSPVQLPEKAPTVLQKMEMALRNENLSEEVVEQCFICIKEEWMNKVKVLFKFTKAGGSRSKEDTEKLFKVVSAQEEDKQLLKFWMTGLSVQYRTHILASSKSQH
ncbi:folliculin-like [Haliotis asinina]|uniref:folliculin-like n=1 Tax=Haliotis asinina TaxID=109174 RepID=UPI0035323013